jgi:hypothetical protein
MSGSVQKSAVPVALHEDETLFTKSTITGLGSALAGAFMFLGASAANAMPLSYDLAWSGAELGNSAMATGMITIDDTVLPNPGVASGSPAAVGVTAFMITISGASAGNGTFTLGDFSRFIWDTGGGTLDLTMQLIGQPTLGQPWGTCPFACGDFNIITDVVDGPTGSFFFQITTNDENGDPLNLTSFAPKEVPEPGTVALFGLGLAGLVFARRRKAA